MTSILGVWIPPSPKITHRFTHNENSDKIIHNRREIRLGAENWSEDVFLTVLKYFLGKKLFPIFPKIFAPIFEFLIKFSKNLDFFIYFSWKNRKKLFCQENHLKRTKTRLLTNF